MVLILYLLQKDLNVYYVQINDVELVSLNICENSSLGRASACQAEGGQFEPGFSLTRYLKCKCKKSINDWGLTARESWCGKVLNHQLEYLLKFQ